MATSIPTATATTSDAGSDGCCANSGDVGVARRGIYPLSPDEYPLPEIDPINYLPRIRVPTLFMSGRNDFYYPVESAQRPFVALLGTPPQDKRHAIFENAGHVPPRLGVVREVLPWLDKYLAR